ncbi:transporter [Gangjinia marincola]|uniref:Transporter n=1 Tax=Gangjinia marincola TaxID=578463 RepID=A0ABP3XP18_9FLAO
MRTLFLYSLLCLFFGTASVTAQYTETINSNRPGQSQGAFSVGTGVLQFETGLSYGQDKHDLLNYDENRFGADYAIRYGFWKEQLEVSVIGSFLTANRAFDNLPDDSRFTNFDANTVGAKYLLYDPYKYDDGVDIRSWKKTHSFSWDKLIPAISIYAGANILFGDNSFVPEDSTPVSPKVAVITQNNFPGGWVLVTNLIGDRIFMTEQPAYTFIGTLTHSFHPNWAAFVEGQVLYSDFYSDDIVRAGGAYLFSDNFQLDVSGLYNFRDTPKRWEVNLGISYRYDMHKKDEMIEDTQRGSKKKKKKKKKDDNEIDLEDGGDNGGDNENQ